jgi:hypothetical protein
MSDGATISGEGVSVPANVTDLSGRMLQTYALDMAMISRNVRDLAKTASFAHMSELEELHQLAYKNLKDKMAKGQPLAEDSSLVIDTFKMISSVMLQTVETKRKAADTLLKARVLIDGNPPQDIGFEEGPFDDEPVNTSNEVGVFGGMVDEGVAGAEDDSPQETGVNIDMAL